MKLFNRDSYGGIDSPTPMLFVVIVAVMVGIFLFFSSWFTVSPGERAFVVTFGHIGSEVYDSGFHLKNPLADTVKMNVQTSKIETVATAASKDLQNVTAKIAVNWNIVPSAVREIRQVYGTSDDVDLRLLQPSIQDSIKATTALFTAEELITKRATVSEIILKHLKEKTDKKGVEVTGINIIDFNFSESFNHAIEAKVTAEQQAQQAKNNLAKIDFEGQQKVVTAEAEKKAIIAKAQGEAEAIKIQAAAIQVQGGSDYIELKRIEKWKGEVPTMITNGTPILNIK